MSACSKLAGEARTSPASPLHGFLRLLRPTNNSTHASKDACLLDAACLSSAFLGSNHGVRDAPACWSGIHDSRYHRSAGDDGTCRAQQTRTQACTAHLLAGKGEQDVPPLCLGKATPAADLRTNESDGAIGVGCSAAGSGRQKRWLHAGRAVPSLHRQQVDEATSVLPCQASPATPAHQHSRQQRPPCAAPPLSGSPMPTSARTAAPAPALRCAALPTRTRLLGLQPQPQPCVLRCAALHTRTHPPA